MIKKMLQKYKTNVLFCLVIIKETALADWKDSLTGFEEISCHVIKGPVRGSHSKKFQVGH